MFKKKKNKETKENPEITTWKVKKLKTLQGTDIDK